MFRLGTVLAVSAVFSVGASSCLKPRLSSGRLPADVSCLVVLPFEVRFDPVPAEEMLSEFLELDLARRGYRGVLGPSELSSALHAAGRALPVVSDPITAGRIAGSVGADAAIFGSIVRIPVASGPPGSKAMLRVDVDAYLIHRPSGEIRWTYEAKDMVDPEEVTARLSEHSDAMAASLLEYRLDLDLPPGRRCFAALLPAAPRLAQPRKDPVPLPPPPPAPKPPVLTPSQLALLADLRSQGEISLPDTVFEGRTAILTKQAVPRLRDLAAALSLMDRTAVIEVRGHIDATADPAQDLRVSVSRAEAVKVYLGNRGVGEDRVRAVGFGGGRPKLPNINERSRRTNARTEIALVR